MSWPKRPRRPFAVDKKLHLPVVDDMFFDLTGIVRDVIEQRQLGLGNDFANRLAHEVRDDLPIGERAVHRRAHGAEIGLSQR